MRLGLGIDTGGTYTDAVIYDFDTGEILDSGKSTTIKEDLKLGIINTLDQLSPDLLKKVTLVSLSTTLATNACVEDKGSRATLVLIGCDRDTVAKYGKDYGLPPVDDMIFIEGGHNQQGDVIKEPNWEELHQKINDRIANSDSFGIVQMWGVRNPEFEKKAKQLIQQWTGMPVVCGHELAGQLNFLKRAATVLLNARLIPLINEFIDAVKLSMAQRGIESPLVIVRGDGSIMSEEFVRERPVETLLSGPASSVIGGINLSGEKNCLVVDMGGTTSDFALVQNGRPLLAYEGANVGNWKTATQSVYIRTIGLGGDSMINFDSQDNITIGPRRVAPLSWLATKWPGIMEEIKRIYKENKWHTRLLCQFFYLVKSIDGEKDYRPEEKRIVEALKKGPLSLEQLAERANCSIYRMDIERLESLGIVMRSGLTPTDIMHITGDFTGWNKEAALLGAEIFARRLNKDIDLLTQEVNHLIKQKLYINIVRMLLELEDPYLFTTENQSELEQIISKGFGNGTYISLRFKTDFSLIGIGAPIHIYLPDVAAALDAKCIIPEKSSVANAVGAITGNIMVEERIIIKPRYTVAGIEGYDCFSPRIKVSFENYEEALEWAKEEAEALARQSALERGAGEVDVTVDVKENNTRINIFNNRIGDEEDKEDTEQEVSDKILLETVIEAYASGNFKWIEKEVG